MKGLALSFDMTVFTKIEKIDKIELENDLFCTGEHSLMITEGSFVFPWSR